VLALVAPLGVVVATGLTGGVDDDLVETASDGGARGRDDDRGDVALRGDGGTSSRDRAGSATTSTAPATTAAPTTTATTAPPTTPAPTEPPTTAPPATAPPATDPPAPPPPPAPAPTEAGQVVALVNAARAEAGCGALAVDDRLTAAAQGHSDDMAAQGYFSHTSLDGRSFVDRVRAAGYPNPGGENIAQGQRGAQAVHDAWMNSQGHRENILNCGFTTIGVGLHASSWTWTQNFGY
jgi:uncharacterized protein YkwD